MPCCTRTWHFLPLSLQRTDTNALMLFKLVYKLGQVCGPLGLMSRYWQTWPESINECRGESASVCTPACLRELTPDLKNVWRTQPFSFSTQRKRANGSQNARGKHSSNNARVKGADQRESCLQFRPTRQFFPRLPGERAQREINLRYQFAEFCSIDGWVPGDFTPSAQEPGPVNKIT